MTTTTRIDVGSRVTWEGPLRGLDYSGTVVAVIPGGIRPARFRTTMDPELARRWPTPHDYSRPGVSYLIEMDGERQLRWPHPSRLRSAK